MIREHLMIGSRTSAECREAAIRADQIRRYHMKGDHTWAECREAAECPRFNPRDYLRAPTWWQRFVRLVTK